MKVLGTVVVGAGELVKVLEAALAFASVDATRPILQTVQVRCERGEGLRLRATATDSYVLGTGWAKGLEGTEGGEWEFLLGVEDAKEVVRVVKGTKNIRTVEVEVVEETEVRGVRKVTVERLVVETGGTKLQFVARAGDYPSWEKVLVRAREKARGGEVADSVTLAPALLALLGKVVNVKRKEVGSSEGVKFTLGPGECDAVLLECGGWWEGLIMPVRKRG